MTKKHVTNPPAATIQESDKMRTVSRMKKTFVLLLACILTLTTIWNGNCTNAQAASKKWKKACKAYTSWLAKNNSKFKPKPLDFTTQNKEKYQKASQFMIIDLDKNGIPELITIHPYAYKQDYLYVYTYKSGKVSQLKLKKNWGEPGEDTGKNAFIDISCNAAGRCEVYKCKKGHLHVIWEGGRDGRTHSVYTYRKEGILSRYAFANEVDLTGMHDPKNYYYSINEKKVSAKKYKKLIKKCGKLNGSFYFNTKANRKKYLK